MKPKKRLFFYFLFFISMILLAQNAFAAVFNLQVTPRRGGNHIRFEPGEAGGLLRNEEVTLSIQTDVAVQYQVSQTLFAPLTNEAGNTIPEDAFVVFSPSNPLGTLRTQLETSVATRQMTIYTSNDSGDSDEFLLVYNVRVPENQPGGVYQTQISFVAEPIHPEVGFSRQTTTINVRVEIAQNQGFAVHSSLGGTSVDLGKFSDKSTKPDQYIIMEITGDLGTPYQIVQEVSDIFTSPSGEYLDSLTISQIAVSQRFPQEKVVDGSLVGGRTIVYRSDEFGSADKVELHFQFSDDLLKKAGVYSGTLTYRLESTAHATSQEVFTIPVRLEVEEIFYLDVQVDKTEGFDFGMFVTGEEEQEKKATITAHSNLGTPYQISQVLTRKLTNSEGEIIPKEHFMFSALETETGQLMYSERTPVDEGETLIFVSDSRGTPEVIALTYTLTVPRGAKSGQYNSETMYSITAI